MPTSRRDSLGGLARVAGEQHRRQVECFERLDRLPARRLHGVDHGERRTRGPVPGDGDRAVAPPDLDRMAFDRADDADAGHVSKRRHRRKLSDLAARCGGDRLRDRVLRRRFHGSRVPQDLGAARAVEEGDVRQLHPTLGDRSRLVEDDGGDALRALEDLGALDQDPELRAASGADHERGRRREPERARARDDQHGDGRREGGRGIAGDCKPADEGREREDEHDRDEDARHAVDEALDGCLPRLRLGHEPGDLRQRRLLADLRRTNHEPPERVDRRPRDGSTSRDVDRHRLAREHRLVDGGLALDDDSVRRHLLARTDDEEIASARARRSGPRPRPRLGARGPPSRRARGASGSQRSSGVAPETRGSARAGSAS